MDANVLTKTTVRFTDKEKEIINAALRSPAVKSEVFYGGYPRDVSGKINSSSNRVRIRTSTLEQISEAVGLAIETGDCEEVDAEEWREFRNRLQEEINRINRAEKAVRQELG